MPITLPGYERSASASAPLRPVAMTVSPSRTFPPRIVDRAASGATLSRSPIHHLDLAEEPTMIFDGFKSR